MSAHTTDAASPVAYYPGSAEYDEHRAGFQAREHHQPAQVVAARAAGDVVAAVRHAAESCMPIAVQATGHGLANPLAGAGVLVSTRRMDRVDVDPGAGTAWVGAGARWRDVIEAAARYGLAPLSGSMPGVGAVSYTLGGGLGLMARRYGFAADHVTRLELVTVDGSLLSVSEHEEPDLFWALRGGGGSFGIVTGLEMALMPVARLVGGGLMFDLGETPEVVSTWLQWTAAMPSEMTSAMTMLEVSERHMAHVQIAYLGSAAEADELVAPLRALKPAYDGLQEIPYRRSDTVFSEPDQPHAYVGDNVLLRAIDEERLWDAIAASAPEPGRSVRSIISVRHLGGALSTPPRVANAVSHREAMYLLCVVGVVAPTTTSNAASARALHDELLANWSGTAIGSSPNFTFGRPDQRAAAELFDTERRDRLLQLARKYDPAGLLHPSFVIA
ncbi:FAD-binding oxidoreductase [Streptomyces sp. NPDC051001]|uniref:FAD-binding oxidoreductase n=1 Tax=Streptomyces sp. NPDC051001 TaxID=3155795 RepID=UPI0034398FE9